MKRTPHVPSRDFFAALESRFVLADSDLPFVAYFPEGFSADHINEFVPITNPNPFAVQFQLHARYEVGERDQLIAEGTIPAFTRGGVTISDSGNGGGQVVREWTPYALVLMASARVSATLSHYDFGTAIGESFTATTSTQWSFGEGWKDTLGSLDFILVYNPNDTAADVTLDLYGEDGRTATKTIRVEAQRRAGWSVQDIADQPAGFFAARVSATAPVVASQSHYELQTGRGYGAMGMPGGGTTAGMVPGVDADDRFEMEAEFNQLRAERNALSNQAFAMLDNLIDLLDDIAWNAGYTFYEFYGMTESDFRVQVAAHAIDESISYEYGDDPAPLREWLVQRRDVFETARVGWNDAMAELRQLPEAVSFRARVDSMDDQFQQLLHDNSEWLDRALDRMDDLESDIRDNGGRAYLSILNANPEPTWVTFAVVYDDGTPMYTWQQFFPAQSKSTIPIHAIGIERGDDEFGIAYVSTRPVSIIASSYQGLDGTGAAASAYAATRWDFGEGYMSRSRGGLTVTEDLYVFNSESFPITITIDFFFWDGSRLTITRTVSGAGLKDFKLHDIDELRLRAEDQWYGLRVTATQPVVCMLEHWDEGNGGGFSTMGMPSGTVVPL